MARRRNLRLPSSSDEDEEPQNHQHQNPNPNPYTSPSSPPPSPPLEISDDDHVDADFVDAPDALSDPSPPDSNPIPNPNPNSSPNVWAIDERFQRLGLRLRREWLEDCVTGLERSVSGFERLDVDGKAKLCFEHFLLSDMNYCGAGVLPPNASGMHKVELEGPFVLQVRAFVILFLGKRRKFCKVFYCASRFFHENICYNRLLFEPCHAYIIIKTAIVKFTFRVACSSPLCAVLCNIGHLEFTTSLHHV